MDHFPQSSFDVCEQLWPLSDRELLQARLDGIPGYALTNLMHFCCLEPAHQDLCLCECGESK